MYSLMSLHSDYKVYHYISAVFTLKRVEKAEEEDKKYRERSEAEEGQTPCCPEEAAESPDAEKSHSVLPPFLPCSDLPVDQEEHHKAREHQYHQECQIGEVVCEQGRVIIFHPAPGNPKIHSEGKANIPKQHKMTGVKNLTVHQQH